MIIAPVVVFLFPGLAETLNLSSYNPLSLFLMWVFSMIWYISIIQVLKQYYFPYFPDFSKVPSPSKFVRFIVKNMLSNLRVLMTLVTLNKLIAQFIMFQLRT